MKQLLFLVMCVVLISGTSAITYDIIAGESYSFILNEPYSYYTITGNLTIINLELIKDGNNITIIPDKYIQNDTFTITFFNEEDEVIPTSSGGSSGGGSGGSNYEPEVDLSITYKYKCSAWAEWGSCIDGAQRRECSNIVFANESSELYQIQSCEVENKTVDVIDIVDDVEDIEPKENYMIYYIFFGILVIIVFVIIWAIKNKGKIETEIEYFEDRDNVPFEEEEGK